MFCPQTFLHHHLLLKSCLQFPANLVTLIVPTILITSTVLLTPIVILVLISAKAADLRFFNIARKLFHYAAVSIINNAAPAPDIIIIIATLTTAPTLVTTLATTPPTLTTTPITLTTTPTTLTTTPILVTAVITAVLFPLSII
ncbi:hypothetical protein LENED_008162 [Lentinula edodes]|uniref:Uncharacterized protein n=1 Tax=Lentinula edodes TaxID=5353 RepID=A0A1Q3EGC7_LENED|nr:hypothetical protein LENED_008162 [Lentinula edodes]